MSLSKQFCMDTGTRFNRVTRSANLRVSPQNAASASYAALYVPQEGKKNKKGKSLWIFLIIVLLIVGMILLIRSFD